MRNPVNNNEKTTTFTEVLATTGILTGTALFLYT